jgi:hypothetical protein
MSIVLQTLIQYWFVHKADMSPYNGTGYDPDNQPVVNYGATQLIPDCRLYDLTEAEINSLTEAGVVNATKKLLVPPSVSPVYMSKISNVRTNGKDIKKIIPRTTVPTISQRPRRGTSSRMMWRPSRIRWLTMKSRGEAGYPTPTPSIRVPRSWRGDPQHSKRRNL